MKLNNYYWIIEKRTCSLVFKKPMQVVSICEPNVTVETKNGTAITLTATQWHFIEIDDAESLSEVLGAENAIEALK